MASALRAPAPLRAASAPRGRASPSGKSIPRRGALVRAAAADSWRGPSSAEETAWGASGSDSSASSGATATASDPTAATLTRDGKKRVVITGMGCVTAHGNDVDTFYEKLLEGESAVTSISEWAPHEDMATAVIAAEIKGFDPEEYMTKKMARRVDPFIAYQIVAAKKALHSAKLPFAKGEELDATLDVTRSGCLIGSAMGGMHSFSTATENLVKEYPSWIGHKKMNPFCIPFAITNMGSALTAMDLGFMGPNYSISSACASGNFCILNSVDHIRNGEADVMLAGAPPTPRSSPRAWAVSAPSRRCPSATTNPRKRRARGTNPATVSSWARARACSCSSRWSTRWREARPSSPKFWEDRTRATRIT